MNYGSSSSAAGIVRRLAVVALALCVMLMLTVATTTRPAQAQQYLDDVVLDLTTDIEVGDCNPDGTRTVTFDALLGVNADIAAGLLDDALAAVANVAVFEFTVTDADGNVVGTFNAGDSVNLQPGNYTVTTTVVNVDAVVDALEALGLTVDLDASVLSNTEPLVIDGCPDDGGPGGPGDPGDGNNGDDQDSGGGDVNNDGNITVGDCSFVIQNPGNFSSDIVQTCKDVINKGDTIVNKGDTIVNEGDTVIINGDGNIVVINGDGSEVVLEPGDQVTFDVGTDVTNPSGEVVFSVGAGDILVINESGQPVVIDGSGVGAPANGSGGDSGANVPSEEASGSAVAPSGGSGGGTGAADSADSQSTTDSEADASGAQAEAASGDETETISVLPDTGGASVFVLVAGTLLVAGGLIARRIVR